MYIHLLKFNELPDHVYKIILTYDDINIIKNIHNIFYQINDTFTYFLDDINSNIFTYILEYMETYHRHKYFIYCYDLDSFEKMICCVKSLDEFIENICTENIPLKLTKSENKKIYEIIKFFINKSSNEYLFICEKSLYNLKHYDENIHKIYLDDNSTIYCTKESDDISNFETQKLLYVSIIDSHIYLSESYDKFIELNDQPNYDNLFENLNDHEINTMSDYKSIENINLKSTPINPIRNLEKIKRKYINTNENILSNLKKEVLSSDMRGLAEIKDQYTNISKHCVIYPDNESEIEAYNNHDYNTESIISKTISYNFNSNEFKSLEKIQEQRNDIDALYKIPTTIEKINTIVNSEYKLYDENELEEPVDQVIEDNISENVILFINNTILDKYNIIYDNKIIEKIKNCKYLSEIETTAEYVIPELDTVRELLEIKLKNVDKLTYEIIEKNIIKINDFLYGDNNVHPKRIINTVDNKSEQMIGLVRDFLVKNCVRKIGSKIYSNHLFNKFAEYLMTSSPTNIVYFNKNNFTPFVKNLNYKTKRDSNGIYWVDMCYMGFDNVNIIDKFGGKWLLI